MSVLTEIVRNILVIIIMASFLELLLPEGAIRPFVRFAIGLFVLIAVLNPVLGYFFDDSNFQITWWDYQMEAVEEESLLRRGQEKAQNELKARNLSLGKIKREESQEYYKDYVISQEIDAGVRVDEATSVDLTVSQGPGPTVKTKVIKIVLPEETDYYNVQVTVDDVQGQREVYNEYHQAGDTFSVAVSYSGTGKVVVRLNGQVFDTINL
jgi:stage III sporulation protein AF